MLAVRSTQREGGDGSRSKRGVLFYRCANPAQLIELAQRTEQLVYSALWYPEVLRYESFSLGSFLLAHSKTLIIASGASAKWLGLENECKLKGHGLTSCATCDGAFYRDVPVCVVGGGDTAAEEAIFLTRFASEVFLIHRRNTLRATKIMAERALNHRKIKPIWNTVISRYIPDHAGEIQGVELRDTETDEFSKLGVKCVFVAIGHTPNTEPFKGKIDTDANGYIRTRKGTQTNLPGVFAAGDVADPIYRQAVTAAGQGCAAAIEAERYLTDLES